MNLIGRAYREKTKLSRDETNHPPDPASESPKAAVATGEPVNVCENFARLRGILSFSPCLLSDAFSVVLRALPCLSVRDRYICQGT